METRNRTGLILMVEDNLEVGSFVQNLLEGEDHEVCWISQPVRLGCKQLSWEGAVTRKLESVTTDQALLDVDLFPGGGDGRELARLLHRLLPDLPITIMSGRSPAEVASLLHEHVIRCFVPKPLDADMLVRTISAALVTKEEVEQHLASD